MYKEAEPEQGVGGPGRPRRPIKLFKGLSMYVRVLNTLDIASAH